MSKYNKDKYYTDEELRAETRAEESRRRYAEKHPWLYKPRDWERHDRLWRNAVDLLVLISFIAVWTWFIVSCWRS